MSETQQLLRSRKREPEFTRNPDGGYTFRGTTFRPKPRRSPKVKLDPEQSDLNELLPYGGQVYLGRTKQPDGWMLIGFLLVCLCLVLGLGYYCVFHFHDFHFQLSHAYAKLGHAHAQHVVGERLLHGKGVPKNEELAMEWFRKAADQGHPHSSYNLAIGHLQGIRAQVGPGEVHDLIRHAHDNGVEEAADVLKNACRNGICD